MHSLHYFHIFWINEYNNFDLNFLLFGYISNYYVEKPAFPDIYYNKDNED